MPLGRCPGTLWSFPLRSGRTSEHGGVSSVPNSWAWESATGLVSGEREVVGKRKIGKGRELLI